jgi:hypothetical protein
MEAEDSLQRPQEPATSPYPVSHTVTARRDKFVICLFQMDGHYVNV